MTQVTLGNFFTTSNGKSVLGGAGGSGLDTQTLITSLVAAKSLPATNDQTQITSNGKITTALNNFQTLLGTFQSAATALRNPPSLGNDPNNAFQLTTSTIGNGGSSYVSATTTSGAALQSYNISNISKLASNATQGTATYDIASASSSIVSANPIVSASNSSQNVSNQFAPGTITVNGQNITLKEGDSLNTVAADFNAVSTTTGISATVIQVGTDQFQLSFNATKTGTAASFDLTSSSTVSSDPSGVLTNAGIGAATAGNDAKFDINGVPITRSSNNVSDLVSGVTFNLLQTTPDATTNYPVTVSADTTTIQNAIVNFVSAYNAIQTFAAQQTQLNSDGTYASTAILANNQVFRQTISDVQQDINSQVSGLSSGNNSLSDIGITLTSQAATSTTPAVSNILTVDDGTLSSALSTNFSGVQNLFGLNLTSDNPNVKIFSSTNSLSATSIALNIDPTNNVFSASYTDSNGVGQTVNLTATAIGGGIPGYTLTGPAGSALAGLELIYGSNSAGTANLTASQGVAAQAYNTSHAATATNTGTLAVALTGIQTQNTTLNSSIAQINTQVSQYQSMLLAKFAALESAVSSVNTLLDSLTANDNAKLEASQ